MQRTRIAISCLTLVGVLCLSLFLLQTLFRPEPRSEIPNSDPDEFVSTRSTLPTGTDSTSKVTDPHQEEVVLSHDVSQHGNSFQGDVVDRKPIDPDLRTVELTDFRGEMKKGKLAKRPWVDIATHPSLPWFTRDASMIEFPDSSESSDRDYFYAWLQLNPNLLHLIDQYSFESLNVETFESGNEYRRARLPRTFEHLKALLDHEAVLALGTKPISEKIPPKFREEIYSSVAGETVEVFITLMTETNLARWRSEVEDLGAVVEHWDPTIRVLVASVPYGKLIELAEWDFVQAVEPVGTIELSLDSSVSVAGADGLRTHLGVSGSFSGITGEGITIGVIDSGLNLEHPDISATRDSICGESFQTTTSGQLDTDDLWYDVDGHGTHVTGIIAGAGIDDRSRAGVAPGVRHIRFAKAFASTSVRPSSSSILKSMDYLTLESSCEWNNIETEAKKPSVVNMSLSSITADAGYRTGAKKLDWIAWNHKQLYVVSQGNARTIGYSQFGAAKNSLPVAWLTDSLLPHYSSSVGPALDGRMVPLVGMSGDDVLSADGAGAKYGYSQRSGTSMSAPAVAGIATLLMGVNEEFATNPALARAQLMATAIKADASFTDEAFAPRSNTNGTGTVNNYAGIGAVSARTAITQGPDGAWSSHSVVSDIENDEYAYIEIDIPEGTDRLDIVLTWDEPPNDNVVSDVMADLDLYLGPDEDCDVTECGEHVSRSRVDNLEYLILSNPESGTKRITVIPHNIFQFRPRIAVAWMYIAQSTPELDIELDSETVDAENVRRPQVDLTVSTTDFVAAGVTLYIACRADGALYCQYWYDDVESLWQPGSQIVREDGTVQDLTGIYIGDPIYLGELAPSEVQDITLVFPPSIKTSSHQLYFSVASANARPDVDAIDVEVDDRDLPQIATKISNDYADTAIELTGDSGMVPIDLAAGARHPGESLLDNEVLWLLVTQRGWSFGAFLNFRHGYTQSRSAWYKLRAIEASKYGIQITNRNPSVANVTFQLISADALFTPKVAHIWTTDQHEFYIEPNKDYYLRVNTYWSLRVPKLEFTWQKLDTKPDNDQFADRIELSGENGDISGNNAFATIEFGEPGGHVSLGTTWFKWSAPADGIWNFDAEALYSSEIPRVLVYHGSSVDNLRLLSDPSEFDATISVIAGEEYQICVSSDTHFTDFQGSYKLTWEESDSSSLMPNDLFANAIPISGSQGARTKCGICSGVARTVEINEPAGTYSHSLWWEWEAPSSENFTFRIMNALWDTLSIFTGSELSALSLAGSGPEIVLDATIGTTYYIALHRHRGLAYSFDTSNNSFQWGITPEYDRISTPLTMTGTSGSTTMLLKYATTSPDESRANGLSSTGVHSSGWGSWTAPSNFTGWMKFSTETWEDAKLQSKLDQYFLAIHERDDADNGWDLVASTDRSYIIGGRPHAFFDPTAGLEYRVQVALRSNDTALSTNQTEVTISWEQTSAPSWILSDLNFHEIGSPTGHNIEELIDPSAGTVVGRDLDKLLLTLADDMLILQLSDDAEDLRVVESVPYVDGDGAPVAVTKLSVIGWNEPRRALYLPAETSFAVLEGLDQSERAFSRCEIANDFRQTPTQVIQDGTGRFIYKIGEGTIAVYRVDSPCELTLVEVSNESVSPHPLKVYIPELEGLTSATFGPDQSHLYGFADDHLLTFARDSETGTLSVVSSTAHSTWLPVIGISGNSPRFDAARVAIDASGDYLFAVGWNNPSVAIFDLTVNRESPTPVAALESYYIDHFQIFPSHIRRPFFWDRGQCRISNVHKTDTPTIEVFCRNMNYVATFDEDTRELYISDWSSNNQPDRFGNQLPVFQDMRDAFGVSHPNGQFSYVIVDDWIDAIHRFERVTGANWVTPTVIFDPYESYLVRLVAMEVEPNEIQVGSRTITSCEAISDLVIDEVTYTVLNSKWQVRDAVGEDWSDVADTVRTDNQLCPYDPDDARDYRLVFEAIIDGITDKYSSNVMVEIPASN